MPGGRNKRSAEGTAVGVGLSISRIQVERRDLGRESRTRPEGKVVKYTSGDLGVGGACGPASAMG